MISVGSKPIASKTIRYYVELSMTNGNLQGRRLRTIMGPITRNSYASRHLCPIMGCASRNLSSITVSYYEKIALLCETKPILVEKLRLKYSFKLLVNELRGGVKN